MSFISAEFFIIVFATVLLYFIFPKKHRWYILFVSSCLFYYVSAGARALVIAIATVVVAYFAAIWISKTNGEKKKKSKLFLAVAIVILLGILILAKIKRYFMWDTIWIIVPLGISYYTFSIIGYLVDVYSKKQEPEKNILKLILYSLYFPKIIQGPISKFRELGPQLIEGHSFNYQSFCFGLQRILWGYFKKLVIVERTSALIVNVFDGNIADYTSGGAVLILTTLIAVIRAYCDFSTQ